MDHQRTRCANCEKSIPRRLKYCNRDCYLDRHRKSDEAYLGRYRTTYAPEHPLADAGGTVRTHRFLLYEKIGPGSHPCHWCSDPVEWIVGRGAVRGGLQVDHLNGDKLDNSTDNLVPSCHLCNTRRGNKTMVADSEIYLVASDGSRDRATEVICDQCGIKFLVKLAKLKNIGPEKVVRCSRACARRARPKSS